MSTETHTIPEWAMQAARQAYADSPIKVIGNMESGALVRHFAKAINDAVMAERERCAKIADDAASGRDWQRSDANAHNDKRAARDFESMKFEAIEIASAIRMPFPAAQITEC